jgi:hypothetical protein
MTAAWRLAQFASRFRRKKGSLRLSDGESKEVPI